MKYLRQKLKASYYYLTQVKPDIPFFQDDANRLLPWVVPFMAFLATLFLLLGVTLNAAVVSGHDSLDNRFSIQVPFESTDPKADAAKLVEMLSHTKGIKKSSIVKEEEVKALLEPWLGQDALVEGLPLPVMIEAEIDSGSTLLVGDNLTELRRKITKISPQATLLDNKQWMTHYTRFVRLVQVGVFFLSLTVIAITTLIMVLATRTGLKLHYNLIQLLHAMGAQDNYISRQFERNILLIALKGTLIGTLAAFILFWIVSSLLSPLEGAGISSLRLSGSSLLMGMILPVLMTFTALYVAHRTVHRMLVKML